MTKTRRSVLKAVVHGCTGLAALAGSSAAAAQELASGGAPQKFLLVGLCGSENPTRANFPFVWASALKSAGHEVRIEIAGDATVLIRTPVSDSVTPVGWPPFREALARVVEHKIPIYV
ncbi:MAG: hypothetical protein WAU32_04225 [Thermoanaerobaculia bacterium]